MATRRRKKAQRAEADQPGAPSWRKPPAKPRGQTRRLPNILLNLAPVPEALRERRLPRITIRLTWRHWVVLLITIAAGEGVYALLTSPLFSVKQASTIFQGNQRTQAQTLYTASGMDQQNIFLVRPDLSADQIVRVPGVAASTVRLRLPDQVIIEVEEYAPLVSWQVFTTTVWLAEDGSPCPIAGDPPPLTLVDATGSAINAEGNNLQDSVLTNLKTIRKARPDLTTLYYGSLEGLYFRSSAGWTVYLGNGGRIDRKLALLGTTERDLLAEGKTVSAIDLRFDGRALLK